MKKSAFILALVRFGGGVSEIIGSIAGNTFARNGSGAYMRNRTKPTNPKTTSQTSNRNRFGTLSTSWRSLTQNQRNGWIGAVENFPYTNKLGETQLYSGQQLYNKLNGNLTSVGATKISDAPQPITFPTLSITEVLADVSDATITFTATAGGATTVPTNMKLRIYASMPLSAGKQATSSGKRFLGTIAATESLTDVDITAMYETIYGTSWKVAGLRIVIHFDLVSTLSGQSSAVVISKPTVIA